MEPSAAHQHTCHRHGHAVQSMPKRCTRTSASALRMQSNCELNFIVYVGKCTVVRRPRARRSGRGLSAKVIVTISYYSTHIQLYNRISPPITGEMSQHPDATRAAAQLDSSCRVSVSSFDAAHHSVPVIVRLGNDVQLRTGHRDDLPHRRGS